MKQCLTCGRHQDEGEKFCDQDGTPLVKLGTVAGRSGKGSPWAVGAAALLAGVAVFSVTLLAYSCSPAGREEPQQGDQQLKAGRDASAPLQPAGPATPTPTPAEATPTPEQSPTPSPSPTPPPPPPATPESPLASLSDSPASTGGSPGHQLVIRLDDGTSVTADDAWRARDGVWYRRGGMVSLIDPARIRSIERQQRSPTPEP